MRRVAAMPGSLVTRPVKVLLPWVCPPSPILDYREHTRPPGLEQPSVLTAQILAISNKRAANSLATRSAPRRPDSIAQPLAEGKPRSAGSTARPLDDGDNGLASDRGRSPEIVAQLSKHSKVFPVHHLSMSR